METRIIHPALLCAFGTTFFFAAYFTTIRIFKWIRVSSDKNSRFHSLSDGDICSIANRIVSIIQAITAVIAGAIITLNTSTDIISSQHWLTEAYSLFAVNYFAYDLISMFHVYCQKTKHVKASLSSKFVSYVKKDITIFLHHIVLSICGGPIVLLFRNGKGDFIIACFFLTELSTPFVNFRGILLKLGMKDSFLYFINGLLVVTVFFVCRIMIVPFMYYVFAVQKNLPSIFAAVQLVPISCTMAMALFMAPQMFWFVLIANAALSTLSSGKSTKGDKPKSG